MKIIKQMIYLESAPRRNQKEIEEAGWEGKKTKTRTKQNEKT